MSDPTYRIDVEHRPQQTNWPWQAKVVRLSDDWPVKAVSEGSAEAVVEAAQRWIVEETNREEGFSVYVDDDGRPVEGHSVKAS